MVDAENVNIQYANIYIYILENSKLLHIQKTVMS